MHVDSSSSHRTGKDGARREYRRHLLRRSYRDEQGRPRKETLANLSALPDEAINAIRTILAGGALVTAENSCEVQRSVPHGDVAAAHAMATKLGIKNLLGPKSRHRDLAYALILSRVVRPASKLSTASWWNDTTLGEDLDVASASTDEVYAAMDWLLSRQDTIEAQLATRHLQPGGIAMFDLSSSWVEGRCCELAAFGHSRDNKRGTEQIEYGLLTDPDGRPVAIRVFPGNTTDSESLKEAITIVRDKFGLNNLIMVGDRGMLTHTRIKDLRALEGMDWITALRAPSVAKLAAEDGPLQMSLFDTQHFAEISHPDYPGERLICCRNPALADQRAYKRESLLAATEQELNKIVARVDKGNLTGQDAIGVAVGKVINKYKVGKHIILDITDNAFAYRRDADKIRAEANLDGIYVIRTSVAHETMNTPDVITTYKNLKYVEADFAAIKVDDLDLRPIFHYLANRVRAHVFICMLAAYLVWHLRKTLAPLTFTDENIPKRNDPVSPATRSPQAKDKDKNKQTTDELPVRSFPDLLDHLSTLNRQTITFAGQHIQKITNATPTQRRAFELIGAPIPLALT
jgi:transposase